MFNQRKLISVADNETCSVNINGSETVKSVGESWSLPGEICLKRACEVDARGQARESVIHEYCDHTCFEVSCLHSERLHCGCVRMRVIIKNPSWSFLVCVDRKTDLMRALKEIVAGNA